MTYFIQCAFLYAFGQNIGIPTYIYIYIYIYNWICDQSKIPCKSMVFSMWMDSQWQKWDNHY
jgi:hypothetical protein